MNQVIAGTKLYHLSIIKKIRNKGIKNEELSYECID